MRRGPALLPSPFLLNWVLGSTKQCIYLSHGLKDSVGQRRRGAGQYGGG